MRRPALQCALVAILAPTLTASDWPRYLGPKQDGTSDETGLLRSFPEGGPTIQWTAEVGQGFGGAAVRGGEVWIMDRETGELDLLRVFDLETGEELWRFEYEVPGRNQFPGSRCVPTVEEEMVYAVGGFGHLYCVDRVLQEEVFVLDLAKDYEASNPGFGWAQSPLVFEDLVVASPLAEDVGLVAFDRFTGDEVWSTRGVGASHSSPVLVEFGGVEQILFLAGKVDMSGFQRGGGRPGGSGRGSSGQGRAGGFRFGSRGQGGAGQEGGGSQEPPVGFSMPGEGVLMSLSTEGEVLWESSAYYSMVAIPAPQKIDEEHLFVTGGYGGGSMLLKLSERGGGYEVEKVFHHPKGSQIHPAMLHDGHLYLLANENDNDTRRRRKEGGMMCLDLEGTEQWRTGDAPYMGRGSVIKADGMLIIQDGYSGRLRLVEPTPEEFRVLAEADIFGIEDSRDHQMWAPLALSDGRLLMRSQDELKCVDLRARPAD